MKTKFLILGSNSFSGSSFINFILKKNCKVVGVSRTKEYKKVYLPYKNSHNLDNFKFFRININKDLKKLKSVLKNFRPDYVVNYIAQGMVAESWINPEDWYATNVVAQTRLYKEISKFKFIKKFIHVSTPEVYGSSRSQKRESFTFNPSTPYAISRATTDMHLKKYFENFKLPVIFTRTSNIYGPHQQLYRIVPKTLLSARLNKRIDLHGGGTSKRSFIYVDDASKATYQISIKGKIGKTYHISTNNIISIKNLVKKIGVITKKNFNNLINISRERIGKDDTYNLSSKKIRAELQWSPSISIDEGIKKTLKWIDDNFADLKKEKLNYIHKK